MSTVPKGQESRTYMREDAESMLAAYDAAVIAREKGDFQEAKVQIGIFTRIAQSMALTGELVGNMCDMVLAASE